MGRGVALNQAGWVVLIIGLAFLVYEPALSAGFIWDDGRAITNNPALQSLGGLWEIWTGQAEPDYFPVKSTVLWLLYQLFGARTSPYHVVNIGVHAANAVLIWRVLRRLSIPGAWLAGLIFLVHPTHVESVAWVSECKNTFSTLFGLLSLLAWFQYQRDQRGGNTWALSSSSCADCCAKPTSSFCPLSSCCARGGNANPATARPIPSMRNANGGSCA